MKIRSAVLEILQEERRTERNVEHKTWIFANFDYERAENSYKTNLYCCCYLLANRNIAGKLQRPAPTVLRHSTFTVLHKSYLQPHFTYSNVTEAWTNSAYSFSLRQPSGFQPVTGGVGLYIWFIKIISNACGIARRQNYSILTDKPTHLAILSGNTHTESYLIL